MPEAHKPQPARHPASVDGIRRTNEPRRPTPRPTSPPRQSHGGRLKEQPLPTAIGESHHHRNVIHPDPHLKTAELLHPHGVSHPSLPLPTSQTQSRAKLSIWSGVLKPSLTETHDRRTVWASVGIALCSPLTWLLIATPALAIFAADIRHETAGRIFSQFSAWLLRLTATNIILMFSGAALLLGLIWLIRHSLLLVAYGVQVRRIDNRLVSGRQLWWQSLAKIWRLIFVAIVDLVLTTGVVVLTSFGLSRIVLLAASSLAAWWSLFFNFILLVSTLLLWLMATHRPLSRVMLSITNRPASFVVSRTFGLIFRNWLRALGIGLVWVLAAGITATLLAGVSWATMVYGLVQITTTIGRVALWSISGILVVFVLSCFTVWSNSYWPRAYHVLAHRGYPQTVSQLMSDEPHGKSRKATLLHALLLVILYAGLIAGLSFAAQSRIETGLEQIQRRIPTSLDQILPNLPSR